MKAFKLFTDAQLKWIFTREIYEGQFYSFPAFGFHAYLSPNYGDGEYIDTNPATKSLSDQYFLVKEKRNGFCRGNFYSRPLKDDWWMSETELSNRDFLTVLFMFVLFSIPIVLYNLIRLINFRRLVCLVRGHHVTFKCDFKTHYLDHPYSISCDRCGKVIDKNF